MADTTPFIIYFEGAPQAGDTLYRYTTVDVSLKITGYRILSRDGVSIDLNLYKNGNLLDVVNATGSVYEQQGIPPLYFYPNDILTITAASAPAQPLTGLTIIFTCEITDSVDNSAATNIKRIQTPLVTRFEGILSQGSSFFYYVPTQRIEVFKYQVSLRNSADQDVILDVKRNNVAITQIILASGNTYQEGMIDVFFEVGEEISLTINQCGTSAPGESLLLLLDYRNTTQTNFANFQIPFVIEYEGLDLPESNTILNYHCPRDLNVANVQMFLRSAIGDDLQVGLYQNDQIISSFVLTAGNISTAPSLVDLSFSSGDFLRLSVINPQSMSSALIVTVDYFIESEADDSAAFLFYSDPQVEIVLLARQLGFGGAKADSIPLDNLVKYQHLVDDILNGRLRTLYRVPLTKITETGTKINPWPGAIQSIAQRLVLRYILNDIYSEVEPNLSANIEKNATLANEDLDMVLNRKIILDGQKYRCGNYGSNPYTEPLAPYTPPPLVPPTGT